MFVWLKGKYFKGKMYNDSSEPLTAYGPEYVWKLLYCARIKSQPRSYNCELGGVGVGGGGGVGGKIEQRKKLLLDKGSPTKYWWLWDDSGLNGASTR